MFKYIFYIIIISLSGLYAFYLVLNKKDTPKDNNFTKTDTVLDSVSNIQNQGFFKKILITYLLVFMLLSFNFMVGIVALILSILYVMKLLSNKLTDEDRDIYRKNISSSFECMKYNLNTTKFIVNKISGKEEKTYSEYKQVMTLNNKPTNLFPNYRNNSTVSNRKIKKTYNALYKDMEIKKPEDNSNLLNEIAELRALIDNWMGTKELKLFNKIQIKCQFGVESIDSDTINLIEEYLSELKSKQTVIRKKYETVNKKLQRLKDKEDSDYEEIKIVLEDVVKSYNLKFREVKNFQEDILEIYKEVTENGR